MPSRSVSPRPRTERRRGEISWMYAATTASEKFAAWRRRVVLSSPRRDPALFVVLCCEWVRFV
jgi:hypothetical protein